MRDKFFKNIAILLFFGSSQCGLFAQTSVDSLPSLENIKSSELTEDIFLDFVKANHPIARRADLLTERARQNTRSARGMFDPILYGEYDTKEFKGVNYYQVGEGGIKVPTGLAGIEFKAGFETTDGEFLNPQFNLPDDGLTVIGLSIPLAQGLMIDERRAALKQAKIFTELMATEQFAMINTLLLDASKAYWDWVKSYNERQLFQDFYDLADIKFKGTRQSFFEGDKAAIDTLEAFIQLQDADVLLKDATLGYLNKSLKLSTFLWDEETQPLQLSEEVIPSPFDLSGVNTEIQSIDLPDLLLQVQDMHPELLAYQYQLAHLDIERRLKAEKLKPKVDANYNVIASGPTIGNEFVDRQHFRNNNKWGINVKFPIFLREARGNLTQTKIKISDVEFKRTQKSLEVSNKVQSYYNEWSTISQQVQVYTQAVVNYRRLADAEQIKFDIGESSIFLMNEREKKWVEAKQKLIKLQSQYFKSRAGFYWSVGQLATME